MRGEKVLLFLGAADRDPRHWECPRGHVGLGGSIHQCVGQLLARYNNPLRALAGLLVTVGGN
jgi:4-methoxybenzoate monooxygenase (O-demethylating)